MKTLIIFFFNLMLRIVAWIILHVLLVVGSQWNLPIYIFFSLALQPPWALASAFQFHDHFTDGRIP
jgi:hypothetical protein